MPPTAKLPANFPEPRWPAFVAIVVTAIVYAALPQTLSVGPRWLLIALVVVLEVPSTLAHRRKWYRVNHILGMIVSAILTVFLLWSLTLLIFALPEHKEAPVSLLRSAAALWIANIIVFAVWYWRLDAGGPIARDKTPGHTEGAFLFPQMVCPQPEKNWSPIFVDYLFLAFNHSTAFSPTDTPVLSRWAKLLTIVQALISLSIVIILAARAVNIM